MPLVTSRCFPAVRRFVAVARRQSMPAVFLVALVAIGSVAFDVVVGQEEEARFSNWAKLEQAAETRAYTEAMRGGGGFDAAARGFLEQTALPQLALEANRPAIERVRRRLREVLLAVIANEKAADDATQTFMTFMDTLAMKAEADPAVRVNAMLLVGELQGADRRPWKPATATLARVAADREQSDAVRIAATVGLARHVEAARTSAEERERVAAAALPAMLGILREEAPPERAAQHDWLAARCLAMLPLLGPASPEAAGIAAGILGDTKRTIEVRVRAAGALAAAASPEAKIDAAALIDVIRKLAVESLESDAAAADRLQAERDYITGVVSGLGEPGGRPPSGPFGGSGFPGSPGEIGQPGADALIRSEVCRRAAWRLAVLADAILSDDGKRGLAMSTGDDIAAVRAISQMLRRAAMELDAAPEEAVLRQLLAELAPRPRPQPEGDDKDAEKTDDKDVEKTDEKATEKTDDKAAADNALRSISA